MGTAVSKPRSMRSRRSGKKSSKLYQANVEIINRLIKESKDNKKA
jgi:hypothetical protein